jgi:CIC family chloride channel protein
VVEEGTAKRLVGTVREKDVIEATNREQLRRDLAGGFSSSVSAVQKGKTVDLGDGYCLKELLTPASMIGRSPIEIGIRERTGVQVLLVRSHGSDEDGRRTVRVASATQRFGEGDTLVVAGTQEGIDRLETLGPRDS